MADDKVFRQAVLDRLRSPEQLNTLMQVTDAKGWITLVACAVLVVTAVVWGVLGQIPTTVAATGILIHTGALGDLVAVGAGQIESVDVVAGNSIKKGQIVAKIAQPELEAQIVGLKAHLVDLTNEHFDHKSDAGSPEAAAQSLAMLDTQREIQALEEKLVQTTNVTAAHSGRVVEVRVSAGDVVTAGMPLMTIEHTGRDAKLEALVYIDSAQGKIVKPGMTIELVPSIIALTRDGVLLGRVKTVDSFPSTREGVMQALHNEQLVDAFIKEAGGTPIAVHVELLTATDTPSGYQWSSGRGPDVALTSGTLCHGEVTTQTQRPIALVFPGVD
jgi:Barrel-sandwich domain of CusB or HlyD membrane-fusion